MSEQFPELVLASTASWRQMSTTTLQHGSSARQFKIGFDPDGRVLELVILRFDTGNELLIHAVKAGPHYLDLLL